jgi:ribosomal protein S18 acetylase RimI-like enzyme
LAGKRLRSLAVHITRWAPVVMGLVLVIHFALTLAYLTPLNPLKLRVHSLVSAYMEPFFAQRWSLFAPNLEAKARYLLVSCRTQDAQGLTQERPWMDITRPLRELKQRHRLTPADRLDRAQFAGFKMIQSEDDESIRRLLEKPNDSEAYRQAVATVEQQRARVRKLGTQLMTRVASAACASLYPDTHVLEVRVRVAITKSPPFSKRTEPDTSGETSYVELPWQPYEATEVL